MRIGDRVFVNGKECTVFDMIIINDYYYFDAKRKSDGRMFYGQLREV